MTRDQERQVVDLADSYVTGRLSRRAFLSRLLALGLSASAAGAILAACTGTTATVAPTAAPTAAPTSAPTPVSTAQPTAATLVPATPTPELKGDVRFYFGPMSEDDLPLHQATAAAFNKVYPNVNIIFQSYDWQTIETAIQTSVDAGAHDIYQIQEMDYPTWSPREDMFEDLSPVINDPSWAAEKAHFYFWDRVQAMGPRMIGLPQYWIPECSLFVNLDMVEKAGYGLDSFDSRDKMLEMLLKVNNPPDVYGMNYRGVWHFVQNNLLQAGTDLLTPDMKAVAIKTEDSLASASWIAELFTKHNVSVPPGTYDYAGSASAFVGQKYAALMIDCTINAFLKNHASEVPFRWAYVPVPGHTVGAALGDMGFYSLHHKSPNRDAALAVMKFWVAQPQSATLVDNFGAYPVRDDAVANGYGTNMPQQAIDALPTFTKLGHGMQPFPQFIQCRDKTLEEWMKALTGEVTAEQAMDNCVKGVQGIVFG